MKIYDITLPISEDLPVWPDDPPLKLSLAFALAEGDEANVTALQMSAHTGTHIDAPCHFIPKGLAVDQLHVKTCIDRADLEALDFSSITRILFKTQNSLKAGYRKHPFQSDYIALSTQGAEVLKDAGVQLIGIDAFSIEAYKNIDHATHHLLLQNNIVIIEGLDLKDVPAGDYELIALPIKLKGADGAPTRVVLRELSA